MSWMQLFKPPRESSAVITPTSPEKADQATPPQPAESLEHILLELERWGNPHISHHGPNSKWYCTIDVTVTATGVKFQASSDHFKHPTPLSAALACRENLLNAVKAIGVGS